MVFHLQASLTKERAEDSFVAVKFNGRAVNLIPMFLFGHYGEHVLGAFHQNPFALMIMCFI
jgi:hypothetical protein